MSTLVPFTAVKPSSEYQVSFTPETASKGVRCTVVSVVRGASGASFRVTGSRLSIFTVTLFGVSTLPALSAERNCNVKTPFPPPLFQTGKTAAVPRTHVAPPSSEYSV